MSDYKKDTIGLTEKQVQGMMIGGYEEGSVIELRAGRAVCLDGEVWEVRDHEMRCRGLVNATAVVSSRELRSLIRELVYNNPEKAVADYESARSPD